MRTLLLLLLWFASLLNGLHFLLWSIDLSGGYSIECGNVRARERKRECETRTAMNDGGHIAQIETIANFSGLRWLREKWSKEKNDRLARAGDIC